MKNQEIERKFLLEEIPKGRHTRSMIIQGYLAVNDNGDEVRLRAEAGKYVQAVKSGRGCTRKQYEIVLDERQFYRLWPATEGARLRKGRLRIAYASHVVEVDRYLGDLSGLIIAEVEFPDEATCEKFVPPDWFGTEVTDRLEYSNQNLARYGLPSTFSADLAEMKIAKKNGAEIAPLVREINKRVKDEANQRLVVLIAGGSASGKTTKAKQLAASLGGRAILISMDDYFRGIEFMESEKSRGNQLCWDQPEAVDLALLAHQLGELKIGCSVSKPRYDFPTGRRIGWETVAAAEVIIIEGLFALDSPVVEHGDLKVFISAGTHGRAIRRLLRDVAEREQKPSDVLRYFAEVVEPMHQYHVEKTKAKADLVIDGNYVPEVEAGRFCALERQVKFNWVYNSLNPMTRLIERVGPVRQQLDYYYNPFGRSLVQTGEVLRVRRENGKRILAYKGPKLAPRGAGTHVSDRPKFECEIDEATERALYTLYSGNVKVVEKHRTLYSYRGLQFSHDCIFSDLGQSYYLEFRLNEGMSSSEVFAQLLKKLGLRREDAITKSYAELT